MWPPSSWNGHMPPCFHRRYAEQPVEFSRNQMTLDVEMVVDGGMDRKKALSGASRFEALHLPLSSSNGLV